MRPLRKIHLVQKEIETLSKETIGTPKIANRLRDASNLLAEAIGELEAGEATDEEIADEVTGDGEGEEVAGEEPATTAKRRGAKAQK